MSGELAGKRVLIIVENLPLPFDRRVWQEARTLTAAGAEVAVICPTGKGFEQRHEIIDGVEIYRHPLPIEAAGALGFLLEYGAALLWETWLAWKIYFRRGIDVIQGCNPPDLIFLVAMPFKLLGVRYIFDHHDINPELYEAKFARRGFFWKLMVLFEKVTFKAADASIATNESYRRIAIERGGMDPGKVFVVRSGPDLTRLKQVPPADRWRNGRTHLVGYVGVMGEQEGIDLLLEAARLIVVEQGRDDVQFVLVGGGPSLAGMKALADKLGLADHVTFTGRAPDADLFEVLSTMDVGVNPDRVNAMNDLSTMNKIMEYMAPVATGISAAQPGDAVRRRAGGGVARPPPGGGAAARGEAVIGRWTWGAGMVLLGIVAIFAQIDRVSALRPELALAVPGPFRSFAQPTIVLLAMTKDDSALAAAEARRLVRRRPMPAEHLFMLAMADLRGGRPREFSAAFRVASTRGWRFAPIQIIAAQSALQSGDLTAAANRVAALWAAEPDNPAVNELTRKLLAAPGGPEAFGQTLAGGTVWQRKFLSRAPQLGDPEAIMRSISEARAARAPFRCDDLDRLYRELGRRDATLHADLSGCGR